MTREDLYKEYECRGRWARYHDVPSPWYQRERIVHIIAQQACFAALNGDIMIEVLVKHPLDVRKRTGV